MSSQKVREVEIQLKLLHDQLSGNGNTNKEKTKDIVIDLSETLSSPSSPEDEALCISCLFKSNGLIEFCKQVANDSSYEGAKKSALDLFKVLLEKNSSSLSEQTNLLLKVSRHLYNADKSSKVRCSALEILCLLFKTQVHNLDLEEFGFSQFIEQICLEMRSAKGSLITYHQLYTLGILSSSCPEKVMSQESLVFKVLKEQLLRKTGHQPDLTAAAGAVRGLSFYLENFPQGMDDDANFYSELYPHIHKLLNPHLKLPKRDVQRAALELIHQHGSKFSVNLLEHHVKLFHWLSIWCQSSNRDDHKGGLKAMDTFIVVIANILELQAEDNKDEGVKVFKFFLKEYNELLENSHSSSQISIAVKGYGLLAAACKAFLGADVVYKMYCRVLAVSQQGFFQSSEMLETKVSNLPSYIESLGIIISKMDTITFGMVDNLLQLALALAENFPHVSQFKAFLANRALFMLLAAMRDKSNVYHNFIHNFAYHFILHTCSHEPLTENENLESTSLSEGKESKWTSATGVRGTLESYKDYLPLWKTLLSPQAVGNIKIAGKPTSTLVMICQHMYEEFLNCCLEITEKLDLTTTRPKEIRTVEDDAEEISTDPLRTLKANTPKDFQVYVNLCCLMEKVVPLQRDVSLGENLSRLLRYYIKKSSLEPLVSTHYTILTLFLSCSSSLGYFEQANAETDLVKRILIGYMLEVIQRCKQYRDHLLASCLILILKMPVCIVKLVHPKLVSPLQMSLEMGLSYTPIAQASIASLHLWSQSLGKEVIKTLFPQVLPLILPYLRSQESLSEAETQTRMITVKMSVAKRRRKVEKKKSDDVKTIENSEMRKVQLSILNFLGHLDQDLCFSIITNQQEAISERAIAWDSNKHVLFSMPFQQVKLDLYFDEVLPLTVDKALNSSDRQSKLAACELLHSFVILMIGIGHQRNEKVQQRQPMTALYLRAFETILRLAVDADQVTRQLFLTLTFQVIHWFTNNRAFEHPDTSALLQVVMDGIISANNPSLRDLSAECLYEFVKWSRKQSRNATQALLNFKSVLKRIIALSNHANPYKRLGGCLAWNSVYREMREDEQLCNEWIVFLLNKLVTCLSMCEDDDPLIGTHQQCKAAISHVERIIKVRKDMFNKYDKSRRLPYGMEKGTLSEILGWLLIKISSNSALVRHTAMDLIVSLSQITEGYKSCQDYIEQEVKGRNLSFIISILEEPLANAPLKTEEEIDVNEMSWKDFSRRLKAFLAALDAHVWIISKQIISVRFVLGRSETKIYGEIKHFILEYAFKKCDKLNDDIKYKLGDSSETNMTLSQMEGMKESLCTAVVRIFDLVALLLSIDEVSLVEELFRMNATLNKVILDCLFRPMTLGFNIKDVDVSSQLTERMKELLSLMSRKLPQYLKDQFKEEVCGSVKRFSTEVLNQLPENLDAKYYFSPDTSFGIEWLRIIHENGWLMDSSSSVSIFSETALEWLNKVLFSKKDGFDVPKEVNSKHHPLILKILKLSIVHNPKNRHRLLRMLTDGEKLEDLEGREVKKGSHVLSALGVVPLILALEDPDSCVAEALTLMSRGTVIEGTEFMNVFLKYLVKDAEARKRYSSKLLKSFLRSWDTFHSSCNENGDKKHALLSLLMSAFMVDRDNIIKERLKVMDDTGESIFAFYKLFLCDPNLDLQAKERALKLLPFFLASQESSKVVKECLQPFRMNHLPLKLSEFKIGSLRERELRSIILEILVALELTGSVHFLEFIIRLFCSDDKRQYDGELQKTLSSVFQSSKTTKQLEILQFIYKLFKESANQSLRLEILERILVPCMFNANDVATLQFFIENIKEIMSSLNCIVGGESDRQSKMLTTLYGSFSLIQILYSKVPKEKLFSPGSQVSAAFDPKDTTGKELTKEVFKRSDRIAKGSLRNDSTCYELRRKCACAAYNSRIAALSNVQDQLKFYNHFLFTEAPGKNESIFEGLVDLDKKFKFDIEVNFNPSEKNRFVTVHRKNIEGDSNQTLVSNSSRRGTVEYLATHYLSDSSLREDLSQYDFSSSVVLTQSSSLSAKDREIECPAVEHGMTSLRLDQSDFNTHEVMPNLIAIIRHMVNNKIMSLHSEETPPTLADLPSFMAFLKKKLEDNSTGTNVKLFILRLIMNTSEIFAPYANLLVVPMLSVLVSGVIGSSNNYFTSDLLATVLTWGQRGVPSDENLASEALRFLITSAPQNRADVYKYNLSLIKLVIETWKKVLKIPNDVLISLLEVKNGEKREVEAGLQISGILLANGISPFTGEASKERFISLISGLIGEKGSSVYSAAAEVKGFLLQYLAERNQDEEVADRLANSLKALLANQHGQALSCIYFVHRHYPKILDKLMNYLLAALPQLYGIHRERVLQCMATYTPNLENIFMHMKEQNILENLTRKEAKTQLVSLELLNAALPRLSPKEMEYFLPGIAAFEFHQAPACRELMYELLIWMYDNFHSPQDETEKLLYKEAKILLLKGTKDEDAALRQSMKNFWIQRVKDLSISGRLEFALNHLYSTETEEIFLRLATHIILEATHTTADFLRPIFQHPLTECIFREMKVSPGWRTQHASMIPLFVATQDSNENSFESLVSMTQDGALEPALNAEAGSNRGVQATQGYLFSVTQNPGTVLGDTYNWVTGGTLDTSLADQEFKATHAAQSSSSGLFFTGEDRDMSRYKRQNLGSSSMKPDEPDSKGKKKANIESQLLKRRFFANQDREKQSIHFARQEERRRRTRDQIQKERKMMREAQVTMYRQYRVGELPDVQIPHKALIAPLQALAERDEWVASHLFLLLSEAIIKEAPTLVGPEEEPSWKTKIFESIKEILRTSETCHPQLMKPLLHFATTFSLDLNPEDVSSVCLRSNLEPVGILVLERQLLRQSQSEREPVRKKARRDRPETERGRSTSLWLNIADLYKSLSHWDSVLGILKNEIGELKEETVKALEAESEKNHFEAYRNYIIALNKEDWDPLPSTEEQQVWEEWFIASAENLGQWDEIEKFIEGRFLAEGNSRAERLNSVWELPRQLFHFVFPSLFNSKLMKILNGSKEDGGLCTFVNNARQNNRARMILENDMGLQLGVLAVNQEKMEEARSLLRTAQVSLLSKLVHCSLLSTKSVMENLKNVQALSELEDFSELYLSRSKGRCSDHELEKVVSSWGMFESRSIASTVQTQYATAYRSLYLHFLKSSIRDDSHFVNKMKVDSFMSVISLSLENRNPHLAHHYFTKLEKVSKDDVTECRVNFLKTEATLIRGNLKGCQGKLQYGVEAWCKYLSNVNDFLLKEMCPYIEANYLLHESNICFKICEAINELKDNWNPQDKYMKLLYDKFSSVDVQDSQSWYKALLNCSHKGISRADELLNDSRCLQDYKRTFSLNNFFESVVNFYEDTLEGWQDSVNINEFTQSLVALLLRGMALGSSTSHSRFPRLIHILEQNQSAKEVFMRESRRVPNWMFLKWLNHMFIYFDKAPGPAFHGIIKELAESYPQAVVYPFEVNKESFDFSGPFGRDTKLACDEIQSGLDKLTLVHKFINAISLLHIPHLEIRANVNKIFKTKESDLATARNIMKDCMDVIMPEKNIKNSCTEKGSVYIVHDSILKKVKDIFIQKFGCKREKLHSLNFKSIKEICSNVNELIINLSAKSLPGNLNNYSPWLASFSSSYYKEEIEIPGQYHGLSKPLPEYHIKMASFYPGVTVMESLRKPIKFTITGSDESEHSFLVKSGEDLRTDQRIENAFSMMNSIFETHCSGHLSRKPSLITFEVTPLTTEVGILDWVGSTIPFMDFLKKNLSKEEENNFYAAGKVYYANKSWMLNPVISRETCVHNFESVVNGVPWDLMRRGIFKISVSNEGFFFLRNIFISSYATLCASHWLLGIGDRHLSNFLLHIKSGCVVGIDFGHHFESATQVLPFPELMPFRLTNQIINIMQPLGINGQFRETMISCVSALKSQRKVLIAAIEAFVKVPTNDWLQFVSKVAGKASEGEKLKVFSSKRMEAFRKKLNGWNPSDILATAILSNSAVTGKKNSDLREIILGRKWRKRGAVKVENEPLTVAEQVDILIDHATDPNILGRTYHGWSPYL